MKKKKYLPLYYKWIKTGELPHKNGLCNEFDYDPLFELMKPDLDQEAKLVAWWASLKTDKEWRESLNQEDIEGSFNPLRQTIVLFMAAMNGEL